MEKIQDLFIKAPERGEPLKIRQLGKKVTVPDAKKITVIDYDQMKKFIDMGESNRSMGATQMNNSSSRSHTVVTIEF